MVVVGPKLELQRDFNEVRSYVNILHPDYATNEKILLQMRAFDDGGVDFDTALVACGILAGNKWSGFFAAREGNNNTNPGGRLVPVTRPPDGILRHSTVYFQLHDDDVSERPYPVTVRFQDWRFPGELPPLWRRLGSIVSAAGNNS